MRETSAVVIGAGALGSPALVYLACAGVGQIGVVDRGWVEEGHVATSPLHYSPDVGMMKAESAVQKLAVLNPAITVEPYPVDLDAANAEAIVMGAGVVVDCTASPEVRELLASACAAQGVSLVVASDSPLADRLGGDSPAEAPAAAGVLGAAAALQAIRLLQEREDGAPSQLT